MQRDKELARMIGVCQFHDYGKGEGRNERYS